MKVVKGKMTAFPILTFLQSFVKFLRMVQEVQMKKARRFILTYFHTYIHTDQPSHRISIS